jgi:hypothetical protein
LPVIAVTNETQRAPVEPQTGAGPPFAEAPMRRLGRRHDQPVAADMIGQRGERRRSGGGARERPARCRRLGERHHQEAPAGLLDRERDIEQPEALAAMRFGHRAAKPAGGNHLAPGLGVELGLVVAQVACARRAAGGPAELCRSIRQKRLLLVQQQFHRRLLSSAG